MGATQWADMYTKELAVSIHAPVMGATGAHSRTCAFYCVSIHAPVMGATLSLFTMAAL